MKTPEVTPRERWQVAALALIATYAFFCEYLPPLTRVHLFSDIELYHYPLQRYALQALKEGHLPQWDPSMYCGISFVGNIQAALFYPPMWLVYAANWRRAFLPFKSLEYLAFAHIWLAFVLCYFWLRSRRLERLPSAFGGGVFAFGGYMLWQVVHLGVVTGLPWMPLAFWGIDDALKRGDWRLLWKTTAASALCFTAGYPPSWAAFCITAVIYALAGPARWRAALRVAGALAASLLLAMAQVLPMIEARWSAYTEPRYTGYVRAILGPLFVANWLDQNRSSSLHYLESSYLYWGLGTTFAIAWALGRRRLRPYAQPLAVMAACLFLAVDPHALVYWTIVWIPALESSLQSYNFFEGFSAMAALLTAIGLSDFLSAGSGKPAPKWLAPAAVVGMAAWAVRGVRIWSLGGTFASGGRAAAETALALALLAVALWTLRSESGLRRTSLAVFVMLFCLSDYKIYGTNRLFNTRDGDPDELLTFREIAGVNRTANQAIETNRQYRVTSDGSPSAMDFRMWGLATPQGLDPFLPGRYREMMKRSFRFQTSRVFLMDYRNEPLLQMLGVRYAITYQGGASESVLAQSSAFRLLGANDAFYRVYEYQNSRPPYGWDGTTGEARPTEWMSERRALEVSSEHGGRFGLAEQCLPGWKATVDGRPAGIERWREVFQSIEIGPGRHTVVFEYHSRLLPCGAAISALSLLGLIWMAIAVGRRGSPPIFHHAGS